MSTLTLNSLLALTLASATVPVPAQFSRLPQGPNSPASAQQTRATAVPATAPTTVAPAAPAQPTYDRPAMAPARRATVLFNKGELTINAANSSLNQILQDAARAANMKITGGVSDERVFGNYGPGTPLEVITSLLDGTGANVMFVEGEGGQSSELILTTRNGAPTPPNPNASQQQDAADNSDPNSPVMPPPSIASPIPAPPAGGAYDQAPPMPDPDTNQSTPQPAPMQQSESNVADPNSANGAKTPQQIYDELMKLRQQQQQQNPNQQPQ